MRLQVGRRLDDVGGADQPADPPAGHRVGLRDAVEHDAPVGELGDGDRHRDGLDAVVRQVLVDLVGDHPEAVLDGPAADRLDLLARVDRAGGVGGRAEQQHLRALGARRLELVDGDEVVLGLVGEHLDRHAAGEPDRLGVGRPVRRRQQHLVARVEQGRERLVDRLLAAVGDQHLGRLHLVAGVARGLRRDRLLERGQPAGRGVAVVRRVAAGRDRGLDDVRRRGEVRLPGTEADDRAAGGLERLRLGVDREGRGLGDAADPGGDAGDWLLAGVLVMGSSFHSAGLRPSRVHDRVRGRVPGVLGWFDFAWGIPRRLCPGGSHP